jgi:hypothetical protein
MWNAPIIVLPLVAFAFFYLGRITKRCARCDYLDQWRRNLNKEFKFAVDREKEDTKRRNESLP